MSADDLGIIQVPFSNLELLQAIPHDDQSGKMALPRASSLVKCARQQAYMMTDTPKTEEERPDFLFTVEQGRLAEEISISAINNSGKAVVFGTGDKQISILKANPDFWASGHPDGQLFLKDEDGLSWGFEHKHMGRWQYEEILKRGLDSEPAIQAICQVAVYGAALDWDACLLVFTAQDASSIRSDITSNLRRKQPWAHRAMYDDCKMMVFAVDLRTRTAITEMLEVRARWLTNWVDTDANPANVAREFDPQEGPLRFPCSYCPWHKKCMKDGPDGQFAPGIPYVTGGG